MMARAPKTPKSIHAIKHDDATRKNIPTAEMESFFLREEDSEPRLLRAAIEVTDEEGEVVLEFPFTEALIEPGHGSKHLH